MKWEYIAVEVHNGKLPILNRYGEEGWELTAIVGSTLFYFKRPLKPNLDVTHGSNP